MRCHVSEVCPVLGIAERWLQLAVMASTAGQYDARIDFDMTKTAGQWDTRIDFDMTNTAGQ